MQDCAQTSLLASWRTQGDGHSRFLETEEALCIGWAAVKHELIGFDGRIDAGADPGARGESRPGLQRETSGVCRPTESQPAAADTADGEPRLHERN